MAIDIMTLLKAELDMRNPPAERELQLRNLLDIATSKIKSRGITLNLDDAGDVGLLVSYAAWLYYRRRKENTGPMPEYLRLDLNDRLVKEKARVPDGT